jgi:desulfoferrodoxin (superoxide reductase-like protein)
MAVSQIDRRTGAAAPDQINIYCDESSHLENDLSTVMVLGGIACNKKHVPEISQKIREVKAKHGMKLPDANSRGFEIKWVKVSPSKIKFYEDLIELFLNDARLKFRAVVIPDKRKFRHEDFSQTHNEFYYKIFYRALLPILQNISSSRIFLDIKDTQGGQKIRDLCSFLRRKLNDSEGLRVLSVEQIRSDESEILQLADLLIGAVAYSNRGLSTSSAKSRLVSKIENAVVSGKAARSLTTTSYLNETKVNVFVWNGQEVRNDRS